MIPLYTIRAYLVTIASLAAAVLLRWLLDPWLGDQLSLATLYGAVALAVWVGGFRPAVLSVVLGYLACNWLFITPRGQLSLNSAGILIGLLTYLISCSIIIALGEGVRIARRRAETNRMQLEQEVLERKKAEEALRLRNDEVERLLQALPVTLWMADDPECQSVTGNLYAERLLGVQQGTNLSTILHGKEQHSAKHLREGMEMAPEELPLQRTIATGNSLENLEFDIALSDGQTMNMLCNTVPLHDTDGRVRGAVAACLDVSTLKAAERKIRDSEERYRQLFEQTVDGIFVATRDGRYVDVNPAGCKMFGMTREELLSRKFTDLLDPDEHHRLGSVIASLADGNIHLDEWRFLRKDRSVFIGEVAGCELPDGRLFSIVRDISERRRMEKELRASEERFRLATSAGAVGVWDWDIVSNTVSWSDSLYEIHGIKPGAFSGTVEAFVELIHPDDRTFVNEAIQHTLQDGLPYEVEFRAIRPDGTIIWISTQAQVIRDASGSPVRLLGGTVDITRRKQAEGALAETATSLARERERLAIALRAGQLGVYEWQVGEPSIWWSSEVYPVYGVEPTSFTPTLENFRSLVHPDDREELWRRTENSIARREVFSHEYRIIRPDGEVRWIANRSQVGLDAAGQVERITGVAVDITERKETEEALREADRRKDEFLATLAHELRNPLAPIRNAVQIFDKKCPPIPELKWASEVIDRQIKQMTRLVDDLLEVSRITRGKIELRKQRVGLHSVVNDAIEASRPLIEAGNHTLTVELPPEPISLEADSTRLTQVLLNLLNNAAKYTERGGHIQLNAKREDGHVIVKVKDNGVGIPKAMLPRIFEMFAQVDRSIERSQGGLGIGLTLVQRLVAMHDGEVEARSDGAGQGSEFMVRLPIVEAGCVAPPAEVVDETRQIATQRRILIVDDNHDSADSLAMFLELIGHEVHTAHDGLSAIEAAQTFQPSAILLDIGLPKLNGYEVAQRIRARQGEGVLLIALTGWGQEEDRRRSKAAGFNHHLTKPVNFDDLEKLLANGDLRG